MVRCISNNGESLPMAINLPEKKVGRENKKHLLFSVKGNPIWFVKPLKLRSYSPLWSTVNDVELNSICKNLIKTIDENIMASHQDFTSVSYQSISFYHYHFYPSFPMVKMGSSGSNIYLNQWKKKKERDFILWGLDFMCLTIYINS